jgi:uncharacterized membrane protein YgdD (TMEM256/DUF423 family)
MGAVSVCIGAFGAHALKPSLLESGRLETFELAVRYQFYHALALFGVGILLQQRDARALHYSALFFLLGILFFSGSLYLLCFTGIGILGAVTPIGGIFFILGWTFLFIGGYKRQKPLS